MQKFLTLHEVKLRGPSELKWCGYESIYFQTNSLKAEAFFLYLFGKWITLINNDWRLKLDSERDSVQSIAS